MLYKIVKIYFVINPYLQQSYNNPNEPLINQQSHKWQDKEPTRDEVKVLIRNFLWDEKTGLPVDFYTQDDVERKSEDVFYHVYRAYPTVPSPYYAAVG